MAGTKPNHPPLVTNTLVNQTGFVKELFYYKFPSNSFTDPDGNILYYIVSQDNGNQLPGWLDFE